VEIHRGNATVVSGRFECCVMNFHAFAKHLEFRDLSAKTTVQPLNPRKKTQAGHGSDQPAKSGKPVSGIRVQDQSSTSASEAVYKTGFRNHSRKPCAKSVRGGLAASASDLGIHLDAKMPRLDRRQIPCDAMHGGSAARAPAVYSRLK
jgi:hypothetical protein